MCGLCCVSQLLVCLFGAVFGVCVYVLVAVCVYVLVAVFFFELCLSIVVGLFVFCLFVFV